MLPLHCFIACCSIWIWIPWIWIYIEFVWFYFKNAKPFSLFLASSPAQSPLHLSSDGALFKVKSRTLRVLTMAFSWWRTQYYHHESSSQKNSLFFMEQDARANTIYKSRYALAKEELTWGTHVPCIAGQQNFKCVFKVSFCSRSLTKTYRGVVSSVVHVHWCCLSIILSISIWIG